MITAVSGEPGSGKSYWAVYTVYNDIIKHSNISLLQKRKLLRKKILSSSSIFLKKLYISQYPNIKKPKYTNIHTNIAGFKYNDFKELSLKHGLNVNYYRINETDIQDFFDLQYNLIEQYKNLPEYSEEDTGEFSYARNQIIENYPQFTKYLNSLIIFDEASGSSLWSASVRDTNFPRLKFLQGHRHYFVDIFFMAQNLADFKNEYRNQLVETYYKAQKSSYNILKKNKKYFGFSSIKEMHDKSSNKFTTENVISIPELQEVYSLYTTGANNKGNNPYQKLFIFLSVLLILIFIVAYFIITNLTSKTELKQEETNIQQSTNYKTEKKPLDLSASSLVSCNSFNKYLYCYSSLNDTKYYLDTNIEELKSSLKNLNVETEFITSFNLINFYLKNEYILNFFNLITIQKEQTNEQTNQQPKNNLSIF